VLLSELDFMTLSVSSVVTTFESTSVSFRQPVLQTHCNSSPYTNNSTAYYHGGESQKLEVYGKILLATVIEICKVDIILLTSTYMRLDLVRIFLGHGTTKFCCCGLLGKRDIRVECQDLEVMETAGTGLRTWYGNMMEASLKNRNLRCDLEIGSN
jgi:hypothetical protein